MKTYFVILLTIMFLGVNAQNYEIPENYFVLKDSEGNLMMNENDFDGDGITDLASICTTESGENNVVIVFLSSNYYTKNIYHWFDWDGESYSMSYKNNILEITNVGCMFKCYTTLKLKYYSSLGNMRLIGFDEGVISNSFDVDNGYEKSINLNTGEYVLKGITRKISVDIITLSDIEKYLNYLQSVGSNFK